MKEKTGKLSIKEWAEEDRPREKMLQKGASVLSDAELIAILIGSGNNEETAVQLSQRILLLMPKPAMPPETCRIPKAD